ncbi:hypothetical protein E3E36_09450 [Thermococcus sp. M36]|uniref:hypothetical protein n=1 Tax=Thermococcus sp. M36 TaxID=1638261 RepID=UPI00143894B3|nr:hypothetical protein [Thermococcus sp. M36]NJE06365.1 hypothetical protein [Thermococcus sp. M36]
MSRLVIPLFIALLFLTVPVSAVYYVNSGGFLYGVHYTVFSNGTNALIRAEVDNYGITCGMMENCWAEVYDVYEYLLFFDGSQLYLLNFTPALLSSLPPYAPRNVSGVYFKGITYVNGSWYVNVSVFAYSAEAQSGVNVDYVYRLDTKKFCVERVNAGWSQLEKEVFKKEINGWKIEVPRNFFLVANASDTTWSPLLPLVVNWTQFPVYFTLKKGNLTRNVTLFYINTTNVINGFWFPNSVKIVNVTICKEVTNTSTRTIGKINTTHTQSSTSKTPTSTKENRKICGLAFLVLLATLLLVLRRK